MKHWIGVDLDGTLAHYEGWVSLEHIGRPIPSMVGLVKRWLSGGKTVKIFTARCAERAPEQYEPPIKAWCLEHIGQELEITNVKDFGMVELWDDRCVQVETNSGITLRQKLKSIELMSKTVEVGDL